MSKSPIAELADRVEDRFEDTIRDVKRTAGEVSADTQEALAAAALSLAHASQALIEEVNDRARQAGRYTVREVREHPIATTAIVLSVVAVAAAVLFSRRD